MAIRIYKNMHRSLFVGLTDALYGGQPAQLFDRNGNSLIGNPPAATAPAQFTTGQWSVSTGLAPNEIVLNITVLPNNGGSPITALQYDIGAGWVALEGTGTGTRTLTMAAAGASYTFAIRAVNAIGSGTASATKTANSGAEATEPDVIPTIAPIADQTMAAGDADRTITLSGNNWAGDPVITPDDEFVAISGAGLILSAPSERASTAYTVTVTSITGHEASRSFALTVEAAEQQVAPALSGGSLSVTEEPSMTGGTLEVANA